MGTKGTVRIYALFACLTLLATTAVGARAQQAATGKLFIVESGGKKGLMDRTGKLVLGLNYSAIGDGVNPIDPAEGLIPVFFDWEDRWGYIDLSGKVVIPPRFLGAGVFSEGLAPVVVGTERSRIYASPEGHAMMTPGDGRYGFIDRTGKMVIKPAFESAHKFVDGLAPVTFPDPRGNAYALTGYIDRTGKLVIPATYELAGWFHEGLSGVRVGDKLGFIDKTGAMVIPPEFNSMVDGEYMRATVNFSEGLAAVKLRGQCVYIDKLGKIVLRTRFDEIHDFSEGLAAVKVGDKFGYIDRQGRLVVRPRFDSAGKFSEGLATVSVGDKYGCVDRAGKFVITPRFDTMGDFTDGVAPVSMAAERDGKLSYSEGYVDRAGRYLWRPVAAEK